ncbi:hypothetical protein [Neobacillus rhizophilus]|uniref:Uncharacterized protein n=1 Tax=Neobacillus rhizophilus TaxID=2833579 RepID=A0A942YXA7_9BACI|nr:hypothetical protein [Neobacillus rhizophilus]MBS4214890.1 hypothetical protein [Neobacillus rhizophilus]
MTSQKLVNALALFSVLGGLLIIVTQAWFFVTPDSIYATYLDQVGYIFILLGAIGLYFGQFKNLGAFGLFSFIFLIIGLSLWLGVKWYQSFLIEDLLAFDSKVLDSLPTGFIGHMFSVYLLLFGVLLYGIANAWKGVRWAGWLLIIASVAEVIPFGTYVAQLIAGIGFAWLGITVRKNVKEEPGKLV